MIVECPADIFKQLEDGCGGYVDLSGEVERLRHLCIVRWEMGRGWAIPTCRGVRK